MINCFDQERKPRKSGLRECSIVFVMFVNVLRKGRSRARAQAEGLSSVRTARRTHFSIQPLPLYLLYAGSRVEVRRGPLQRAFLPCNQGGANDTPSDRLWPRPGPQPAHNPLRNTRWRLSAASTRACPRPTRRGSVTLTPLGSSSVQSAPHLPAQSGIASARPWGVDGPPGATGVLSGRGGRKRGPLTRSSFEVMHLMQGCHCALLQKLCKMPKSQTLNP